MSPTAARRIVVVSAAVAVLTVAAVVFALISWKRSDRLRDHVLVQVASEGPGSVEKNLEVATTLESALAGVPGVETMRAESTARGVTLTLSFPPARAPEESHARMRLVQNALEPASKQLSSDVGTPVVDTRPGDLVTWWIATERDIVTRLASIPGVHDVETCGGTRERTVVTLDLARMQALSVELEDVEQAIVDVERSAVAELDVAAVANATLEVAGPSGVLRIQDVAVVSREPARSCDAWLADVSPATIHVVTAERSVERKAVQIVALDADALSVDDSDHAMVVRVMLPLGMTREEHARAISALVPSLRELRGLSFRGAILRDGGDCDLLFSRSPRSRDDLAELRSLVASRPGLLWGGVRGGPKLLRRLTVVVQSDAPDALEPLAADVRERIGGIKGVGPLVSRPIERFPRTVVETDRAEVAAAGLDARAVAKPVAAAFERLFVERVEVRVRPSGAEALGLLRVRGEPLSRLVRVTTRAEPHVALRIDRKHAVELAWEADDDPALLTRVRRALEGIPSAQARIDAP